MGELDDGPDAKPAHWLHRLLDDVWLLLALGVAVPTVSYTLWGVLELVRLPAAKLP